jgi:hypothetical protein
MLITHIQPASQQQGLVAKGKILKHLFSSQQYNFYKYVLEALEKPIEDMPVSAIRLRTKLRDPIKAHGLEYDLLESWSRCAASETRICKTIKYVQAGQ